MITRRSRSLRARAAPLLAAGALLAGGCSHDGGGASADQRQQRVVLVRAAMVQQKDVPIQLHAIGTVEPYASVAIKSRVSGQVSDVHFREGQEVHQDDPLFTIDPRPFEAAVREAEANLVRARAEAGNAQAEAQRLTKLFDQQIVSQDEFDQARTRAESLQAMVKADEAAVDRAKLDVLYCHITAPIDGRIGQILVNQGNVVKTDETTLAVVNQIRPIYVAFSVPQQDLPEIRQRAAEGPLRVAAYPNKDDDDNASSVGELSFINNEVNTDTGTVLLKGLFPNERETLWPGQFVDAVLTLYVRAGAIVVPSAAVQTGQQGQYVFVVGPDRRVELRPIRTTTDLGSEVAVGDGLHAGERVVTEGQLLLAPGMLVELKGDAPTAPAAARAHVG